MLEDDFIATLFSKEELKKLYFAVIEVNETLKKKEYLRERFLSKEELELLLKQEEQEKLEQEVLKQKELEQKLQLDFEEIDKMNFYNIYEWFDLYDWRNEESKICYEHIKNYLNENIEKHECTIEEIKNLNNIINLMIKLKYCNINDIKIWLTRYLGKGELALCS